MNQKVGQRLLVLALQKQCRGCEGFLFIMSPHNNQHMINYIFIPKEGHRDDVSCFEGFLVDSILTHKRINIGYIIFEHMKKCTDSTTSVLPYGMFITKIMKVFGVKLREELKI